MSSNTENTEAKLAAYIDGQLDATERAQIEQYLAANPDHQKLLADMTAQRELLRALPREKAPNDIYDALQSQLERSVLLDDSATAAPAVVRHSRKSQLFSLAAMVLLAISLGAVLFFALPSSRPTPVEVASSTTAPHYEPPTTVATDEAALFDEKAKHNDAKLHYADASGGPADKSPATSALAAATPALRELNGVASNFRAPNPTAEVLTGEFKTMNKELAEAGQEPLVVLVSSDNPSQTKLEVANYLQSKKIDWTLVNAPAQDLSFKRQAPAPIAITAPAATTNKLDALPPVEGDLDGVVTGNDSATKQSSTSIAGAGVSAEASAEELRQKKSDNYQYQKDTLTPAQQQAVANYFNSIEQDTSKDKEQARQLIIARRMTRQQAVQLTDSLSTERGTQRARLLTDIPAQPNYGTRKFESQDASISIAQTQTQVPTQSQAPSADAGEVQGYGKLLRQNDTQAQSQVQTQQAPARQQNETQVATNATSPATESLGTEPSVNRDRAAGTAIVGLAPAGAAHAAPASAPTTQSDEPIDVVILVQDQQPTTAPSTQAAPASQPATEPAF